MLGHSSICGRTRACTHVRETAAVCVAGTGDFSCVCARAPHQLRLHQVLGVTILILDAIAGVGMEVGDATRKRLVESLEFLENLAADEKRRADIPIALGLPLGLWLLVLCWRYRYALLSDFFCRFFGRAATRTRSVRLCALPKRNPFFARSRAVSPVSST